MTFSLVDQGRNVSSQNARTLRDLVRAQDSRIEYSEDHYPGSLWVDFRLDGRVVSVELTASGEFGVSAMGGDIPSFGGHGLVVGSPRSAARAVINLLHAERAPRPLDPEGEEDRWTTRSRTRSDPGTGSGGGEDG